MTRIQCHPACKIFPELGDEELNELADDINSNGLQNPIVLLDGKILDGRNRYHACKLAGVEARFEDWKGNGSPAEWVISQNLMRRHLTASQRAVIALDLLPLLEKEAKDRQRLSNGRGKKGAKKFATNSPTGKATAAAARITKSNSRYVEIVKAVSKTAPEIVPLIRSGEIKVAEAQEIARQPKAQRTKLLRRLDQSESNGKATVYGFRGAAKNTKARRPHDVHTPPGLARFLHDLISPQYKVKTILDPCSGTGALTRPWKSAKVISFEIKRKRDFLEFDGEVACDLVLCNPPFNNEDEGRAFLPQLFLEKILTIVAKKTPIAFFAPMGMRLNQRKTSKRWRWLRDNCPPITSIISLPLDVFKGVQFHSEVLLFNMPRLRPHYFVGEEYLQRVL